MFCRLPAGKGQSSLGSMLLATSHLLRCSHFLPPNCPSPLSNSPVTFMCLCFPNLQIGRKEVQLAVQGFQEDFHLWEPLPGVVCMWRGDVLGVLKAKALASEPCGDLGLEVPPTIHAGCLITGPCHG